MKKNSIDFEITKPVKLTALYHVLKSIEKGLNFISLPLNKPKIEKDSLKDELATLKPKILIAEDLRENMFLVKTIVLQLIPGADIIQAKNGREAIKQYQSKRPDIVLMDIIMPVMDGIETTRAIRKLDTELKINAPIIAITARTNISVKESCYDAGMNDFITKPYEIDCLKNTLARFLLLEVTMDVTPKSKLTQKNMQHFNINDLADQCDGDTAFASELAGITAESLENLFKKLKKEISNNDIDNLRKTAHTIKGAAANVRFEVLAHLTADINNNADADKEWLMAAYEKMHIEFETIKKLLLKIKNKL